MIIILGLLDHVLKKKNNLPQCLTMMASHSVVLVLVHQRMILEKNFRLGKSACITLAARDKGFNVDSNVHLSASVITFDTAQTLVDTIAVTPKGTIAVFAVCNT